MEVALDVSVRDGNQRRSFSEDDTESIHSVQAKETDVVQDTNSDDYDDFSSASTLELEYEVATSDSDDSAANYEVLLGTGADGVSSSGEDDMHVTAAIAAVLCDTSLETWATDCEDSDTTAHNDSVSSAASTGGRGGADFWTCLQCNGRNDQPQVRYCDKCFQVRKNLFPPRPRGTRKRKTVRQAADEAQTSRKRRASNSCDEPPVKLTALQHCLSGLSQDSGLGSSQEIPRLNFDQIIMPEQPQRGVKRTRTDHAHTITKQARLELPSTSIITAAIVSIETTAVATSSVADSKQIALDSTFNVAKTSKIDSNVTLTNTNNKGVDNSECARMRTRLDELDSTGQTESSEFERDVAKEATIHENASGTRAPLPTSAPGAADMCAKGACSLPELKELCMICNESPKNAIFLHGKIAHLCCCYKCAMKTWRISKRCPMCNCKVKNVVKVYST